MTAQTEPAGLVAGLAIAGFAGIGIWLAPVFAVVVACNLIWGIGDGVNRVARTGILQRRTPDVVRARVAAANETVAHLAMMFGFLLAGPAIAALGAQATYAVGGFAALGAAALCATVVAEAKQGATGGPTHADPLPPPWACPRPASRPGRDGLWVVGDVRRPGPIQDRRTACAISHDCRA